MKLSTKNHFYLVPLLLASSLLASGVNLARADDLADLTPAPLTQTRPTAPILPVASSAVGAKRQASQAKMLAAMQLQNQSKLGEAETQLRAVIASDETYAAPYYNLALLLDRQSKFADAAQNYRSFLKYGPQSSFRVEAKLRLAIAEQLAKLEPPKPPDATEDTNPQYAAALLAATAFQHEGSFAQAAVQSQRAVDLAGNSWEAYLVLAETQNQMGDNKNALAAYEKAKALAPQTEKARIEVMRGGAALALKQDELTALGLDALKRNDRSAKDTLFQAWSLGPEREEIGFIAAVRAVGLGDLPLALEVAQVLAGSQDPGMSRRAQTLKSDILNIQKLQLEPIRLDPTEQKSVEAPSELTEDEYENGATRKTRKVSSLESDQDKLEAERAIAAKMIASHAQLVEIWKQAAQTVESFGQAATYQRDRQLYHQSQERAWRARKDLDDLLAIFIVE